MALLADALLIAGALGAGLYCLVLSSRLRRFTDLEKGVGGAVAVLSAQVDDLKKSLDSAKNAATGSVETLTEVSSRAETASERLELLIASLHDIPEPPKEKPEEQGKSTSPFFVEHAVKWKSVR